MELKSAIFDMDGVITDTARIHFKAWKQIFDKYLEEDAEKRHINFEPFSLDDYIEYVDGMSRIDGIKHFLQSRHMISSTKLPSATEQKIIDQIASDKNKVFLDLIQKEGVSAFEGTISLIKEFKKNNIKTGAISSSNNCKKILTLANVINLFETIVDGNVLRELHLRGKPEPDIFLEAAKRLNTQPREAIMFEDALAGVIAGKRGGFTLVVGIDRRKKWSNQFKQEGADIIVNDLSELKLEQIKEKFSQKTRGGH
jgi:trehalose 6-phosphate phosphatase